MIDKILPAGKDFIAVYTRRKESTLVIYGFGIAGSGKVEIVVKMRFPVFESPISVVY